MNLDVQRKPSLVPVHTLTGIVLQFVLVHTLTGIVLQFVPVHTLTGIVLQFVPVHTLTGIVLQFPWGVFSGVILELFEKGGELNVITKNKTVITNISVSVKNSNSSVCELSINTRTARTVSHAIVYIHDFRMLINFVRSAYEIYKINLPTKVCANKMADGMLNI